MDEPGVESDESRTALNRSFLATLALVTATFLANSVVGFEFRVLFFSPQGTPVQIYYFLNYLTNYLVSPVLPFVFFYKVGSGWWQDNLDYLRLIKFGFAGALVGGIVGTVGYFGLQWILYGIDISQALTSFFLPSSLANLVLGLLSEAIGLVFIMVTALVVSRARGNHTAHASEGTSAMPS